MIASAKLRKTYGNIYQHYTQRHNPAVDLMSNLKEQLPGRHVQAVKRRHASASTLRLITMNENELEKKGAMAVEKRFCVQAVNEIVAIGDEEARADMTSRSFLIQDLLQASISKCSLLFQHIFGQ